MKILGVFEKGFVVLKIDETVYLMDQHAAHERVRLEHLQKTRPNLVRYKPSEQLPFIASAKDLVKLKSFGVKAALRKNGTTVKALAECHLEESTVKLVRGLLSWEGSELDYLKMRACHGAIKISDSPSISFLESLYHDLMRCDYPLICAHGRPTFVKMGSLDERLDHNHWMNPKEPIGERVNRWLLGCRSVFQSS